MVLYLVEPAGIFSVVQSFVINLHHAEKYGTPAAAAAAFCVIHFYVYLTYVS